ncbi:MAG: ABC transporter permease [Anaerovoracaceae bacterium]|jgi:peptide/nickel transport system permease protein
MLNAIREKSKSKKHVKQSPTRQMFARLRKNKSSMISLYFIIFLVLFMIIGTFIIDESLVYEQTMDRKLPPSAEHWFGTDIYGRDIFARVVYGARISVSIGLITEIIATLVGGVLGSIGAYRGGLVDEVIMRLTDMLLAIPSILLAMVVVTAMGANATSLIIAISISIIPVHVRLVRSSVLGIADRDFVEAAKSVGMSDFKIVATQIIPNSLAPVIVLFTQGIATGMLNAAGLSYLGLGVQPPNPEWGALISGAREFLRTNPYMSIIPGIVVVVTALSFNLVGDGLRDALDPRLKD